LYAAEYCHSNNYRNKTPWDLKDHSKPTVLGLRTFEFNNLPSIGTTKAGQPMTLGGFSGSY
jgi:hypothetical protein